MTELRRLEKGDKWSIPSSLTVVAKYSGCLNRFNESGFFPPDETARLIASLQSLANNAQNEIEKLRGEV